MRDKNKLEEKIRRETDSILHGPWIYLLCLNLLVFGTFIVAVPVALVQSMFGLSKLSAYIILGLAGITLGFLSCFVIGLVSHKEKREILAGIIIPLPTMIVMYALIQFFVKAKHLTQIREDIIALSDLSLSGLNPVLFTSVYFIFFNAPFIYYFFRKKDKDLRLFAYYVIWPVIMLISAVIINVIYGNMAAWL